MPELRATLGGVMAVKYYFPSDIQSIYVGQTKHHHGVESPAKSAKPDAKPKLDRESELVECPDGVTRLAVACDECMPHLHDLRGRPNPNDVSLLTRDEKAAQDTLSSTQRTMLAAMSTAVAQQVVQGLPAMQAAK